jgi:hypothetical protein
VSINNPALVTTLIEPSLRIVGAVISGWLNGLLV